MEADNKETPTVRPMLQCEQCRRIGPEVKPQQRYDKAANAVYQVNLCSNFGGCYRRYLAQS